ncbi:nuclease-related domain-containing protein [Halopseudomonas laoshanensis]|uniref:nuclease-related domain-containing protein n=1 Tax=Halopseudomonas laoshanensis TaxID=2268758 RepID=UPI0011EBE634|nr:nuclease-related domain-containing protein [Halopseudomonas laoshanensis]
MHIPSERVYSEMRSEAASLWIVPANEGEEIAILIKAPSSSIKALIAGCTLEFLFGKHNEYLCNGVRIHDMPDAPILISGAQRNNEEHRALLRLLNDLTGPVFLFNEMDVCLAWTNLTITESDASRLKESIGESSSIYTGNFTSDCSHALDCFCYSADQTKTYPGASLIPLELVGPGLEPWRINNNSFIGIRENHSLVIDEKNEGEIFERAIWASLESVFPFNIYKNPKVIIGKKTRELTDILAFHQYGSILIEAKDLSVFQAGFVRDQERRTNGVKKQISKAIKQLIGSINAVKSGSDIFDSRGDSVDIVRDQPFHCIILITEMMHWGEWNEIEKEIVEAMRSTGSFFNLLDLREFITLLKGSSGRAELLDYNLMERCKAFVECGSVHLRSQIAPNNTLQPTPKSGASEL